MSPSPYAKKIECCENSNIPKIIQTEMDTKTLYASFSEIPAKRERVLSNLYHQNVKVLIIFK